MRMWVQKMDEIKLYRISGRMMISHDRFPTWNKFSVVVRALSKEHALERVYSELGSRHKLKRYHIKIGSIEEVPIDQVTDTSIIKVHNLSKLVRD